MATSFIPKTVNQIFSELITYKESIPELTGLQSTISDEQQLLDNLQNTVPTAQYILEYYIKAYYSALSEQNYVRLYNELSAIRDSTPTRSAGRWAYDAVQFQYGDSIINTAETGWVPGYAIIDVTKQVISHATVSSFDGNILIKIRGRDTDVLTEEVLTAYKVYLEKIKDMDVSIAVQNDPADKLKIIANVVYDGQLDKNSVQTKVEAAINDYIKNIPFDSTFNVNKLIDKVQEVSGVKDFEINTLMAKATNKSVYEDIIHKYLTFAGYLAVDEAYPLNTYITYESN